MTQFQENRSMTTYEDDTVFGRAAHVQYGPCLIGTNAVTIRSRESISWINYTLVLLIS